MSVSERPRAAVVVTGSELLTGAIADRNGPFGDRPEDLEGALRYAADAGAALIVTSGGLGPTADDLTGEVVAAFAGAPLELDEAMQEHIAGILAGWARRNGFGGPALEAANRKQAMVPRGALAL